MHQFTKIITYISAGKLAIGVSTANAGGLGKVESQSPTTTSSTSFSMDQVGYPFEILTPPILKSDLALTTEGGGKVASNDQGFLYSSNISSALASGLQPRIDFVISGVENNDSPTVIFLAYSTKPGTEEEWSDLPLDNFVLNRDTFNIIGAFQTEPVNQLEEFSVKSTPLGTLNDAGKSFIISLNLSDIDKLELENNSIYFQAVSIPFVNGTFIFKDATVSELDVFLRSNQDSDDIYAGSKVVTDGSKTESSEQVIDNGGKFSDGGNDGTSGSDTGGK